MAAQISLHNVKMCAHNVIVLIAFRLSHTHTHTVAKDKLVLNESTYEIRKKEEETVDTSFERVKFLETFDFFFMNPTKHIYSKD